MADSAETPSPSDLDSPSQPDDVAPSASDFVQTLILGSPADIDSDAAAQPDDSPPSPPQLDESKSMSDAPLSSIVDKIPNAPPPPPPPTPPPPPASATVSVSTSASSLPSVQKSVNFSSPAASNSPSPSSSKPPTSSSSPSIPLPANIIPHPTGSKSTNQPPSNVPSSSPPSNSGSSDSGGSNKALHHFDKESRVGVIAGATAAILVITVFLALIFVVRWRKKKKSRKTKSSNKHISPPPKIVVKSDGDFQGEQHAIGPNSSVYSLNTTGSEKGLGNNGRSSDSGIISPGKISFSYEELTEITHGFSRENVLGEGGFGCVYKGWLQNGRVVAVKQLKAGGGQGDREFKAEVEIISRVHHRHLVSLVGYCISENQRLLIYEFVPNKTLEHHLHGKGMPVLEWSKRMKIAIGSAKGLAYLHEDCHPKIIHRDIKSANILLDDDFEAQVADFGLAKLNDTTQSHVSTRVMGTFGYLAPEYALSGKLTDRSDVFSFGVVLLELITGRKPVDPTRPLGDESLVEWARPLLIKALETRNCSELVDPRLETRYVEDEMFIMIEVAAACVRHSVAKRPRMVKVVRALDNEGEMSDLSNGMKYGQSFTYDSGKYSQEISRFRRLQLGDDSSSELDTNSELSSTTSREYFKPQDNPRDFTTSELESPARNSSSGDHRQS